jgi:hypothetical protein
MKILLMHPPIDDPTLPYHSTAYLAGQLAKDGFTDVSLRDVNIEFVNYCLTPNIVKAFLAEAESIRQRLRDRPFLSFEEQEQFISLVSSQHIDPAQVVEAAAVFRSRARFEDFPTYFRSLGHFQSYMGLLGSLSYPCQILNVTHESRGRFSTYNLDDLLNNDLGGRVCHPFERYFHEVLAHDKQFAEADLMGISIVYDHQLMHALHFARLLRKQWPEKSIVLGGTSISQTYKYLVDKSKMARFFDLCDAIVVGEGESAICEIAESGGDIKGRTDFTNTITYDRSRDRLHLPVIKYEKVSELAGPLYSHQWDLYLSPERGINYSPTRGCYWNRCTFCDYGLNTDSPTSPWRERKIPDVIADLREAKEKHKIKYVYFAVDVMAPGYLERLSDAMLEAGLDMRWSAELRLEKIFSPERCRKMAEAGCVCVSFGMESGNQRILDLIDKGTKVSFMAQTMRNFSEAGIAVQLMAFSDFPTETPEEKAETIRFVKENEPYWSTGGMGAFLLTGTSIIARNPQKFGLTVVPFEGADASRALAFRLDDDRGQRTALVEEADASFDQSGGAFPGGLGRPWAGGTDTLHSMIYYERYGRRFFKDEGICAMVDIDVQRVDDDVVVEGPLELHASLVESPFNLQNIVRNRLTFSEYVAERLQVPAEPTYASFQNWATNAAFEPARPLTYWLISGQKFLQIDKLTYRLLDIGSRQRVPVKELLAVLAEPAAHKMLNYLLELEQTGLIGFVLRPTKKRIELRNDGIVLGDRGRLPSAARSGCHASSAPSTSLVQLSTA